jgi:anti-sigma-K factor RskA
MQRLRATLLTRAAMLAVTALLILLGIRHHATRDDLARDERALTVLTASDMENLRLAPSAGMLEATHARYRGRAGETTAVVTLSSFPPPPAGRTYQAWVRHDGPWLSLGTVVVDVRGNGRLIAERPELGTPPAAVEITLEPSGGSATPSGPAVVSWQRPQEGRGTE